ncbi:FAD-containing oxidoreductase [Sphingosinicella sp. LHD-64]|uniref:FAD-containing oxidoreductase n=1 Tax=Sphingosinicella sp. LHD-64 TaxID=3072139 RepID=UPI00280C6CC9|nr:FAD-containing oxidoreductase [Sphingosinicella sp. LHD-64]MDQ8757737.1 FAD-containing oxidoreductase [Sphingosinicella sp. LHD-64]
MSARAFDAIVIGAGQAGPSLAGRLNDAGMTVALAERHLIGGTCVNTGCMPTKALVASAYAAHLARRAADYGVIVPEVGIDYAKVHARAHQVTLNARTNNEKWLAGMERLTLYHEHARFEGPNAVRVGGDLITAPRIFINVGGRANVPDFPGVGEVPHLDNSSILALEELPRHLIVVGGSYVGLEFGQIFRRFGTEVTIVEKADRLIGREDPVISDTIRQILEDEGINIRLKAECISLIAHPDGPAIGVDCREGPPVAVGSHILLAVGRRPNTDDLGLEAAGITADARGYITVNDRLETSVPGIWAIGDCNGRGAFTHTSYNDYEIVAANLLDGQDRGLHQRLPGYALYTDPPLGRVGMTETEARKSGRPLLVSSRPMTRVGRAIEKGETKGLMTMVADAETRRILGAAILGAGGDEAIHGILDMMNADQTIDALRWAVPIHPTVSELIPTLIGDLRPA